MGMVAVAAGLLVVAGVLGVVSGTRRRWPEPSLGTLGARSSPADSWARLTRRPLGRRGRRRDALLLLSIVVGFVLAAVTGWVIALPLVPVLVLGLPYLLALPKAGDVELMEALDRWVRSMASTLTTGRSITDAIRVSRRTAPPLIADELGLLVSRLNNRWDTREALLRFADDLGSADADAVIAALILASSRGSNGASVTLHALADSLQDQLKGRRVIETERSKPYVVVRQVTIITVVTLAVAFVFGRSFFAPYGTAVGQVILSVLITLYLASLLLLRRQARQAVRPRILVGAAR
jgi:hypothetical protein